MFDKALIENEKQVNGLVGGGLMLDGMPTDS